MTGTKIEEALTDSISWTSRPLVLCMFKVPLRVECMCVCMPEHVCDLSELDWRYDGRRDSKNMKELV